MFVVDVSPHMGATRSIELPDGVTLEITHLEWALQFVMMKVEEMVRGFSSRFWCDSYTLCRYSTAGKRTSVALFSLARMVRRLLLLAEDTD